MEKGGNSFNAVNFLLEYSMKTILMAALSMLGTKAGHVLCEVLWDTHMTEFSMEDDEHAKLYAGSSTDRYVDLVKFATELGWTVSWSNWEYRWAKEAMYSSVNKAIGATLDACAVKEGDFSAMDWLFILF